MPSTDITTCASLHCPKRWRCALHYTNVAWVVDTHLTGHWGPYRSDIGGCEYFREVEVKK